MSGWYVALLGLIEGATEFLPVSSTAHLMIAQKMLGFHGGGWDAYAVVIQFGALLAAVVYYRKEIYSILQQSIKQKTNFSNSILFKMALASLPVLVMGVVLGPLIKKRLFSIHAMAGFLLIGGIIIIASYFLLGLFKENKTLETLSMKDALGVGGFQVFSLLPGMSRSLTTIIGGKIMGLSHGAAIDMTFLLAIPVLSAASIYSFIKYFNELVAQISVKLMLIGLVVSFISGLFFIHWMIQLVRKMGLLVFGIYRIILAGLLVFFW